MKFITQVLGHDTHEYSSTWINLHSLVKNTDFTVVSLLLPFMKWPYNILMKELKFKDYSIGMCITLHLKNFIK